MNTRLKYLFLVVFILLTCSLRGVGKDDLHVYRLLGKYSRSYHIYDSRRHTWVLGNTGEMVELENGMFWEIGWWWKKTVRQWDSGDRIAIYYYPLCLFEIHLVNLDRNESAWGACIGGLDFRAFPRLIQTIDTEQGRITLFWKTDRIELVSFEAASKELLQDASWEEQGKVVAVLGSGNSDYPYWIYNMLDPNFNCLLVKPVNQLEK